MHPSYSIPTLHPCFSMDARMDAQGQGWMQKRTRTNDRAGNKIIIKQIVKSNSKINVINLIKRQFAAKINPAYNYIKLKNLCIVD